MNKVFTFLTALPSSVKIGGFAALFILGIFVSNFVGQKIESLKYAKFEQKQKELEQQIQDITKKYNEAITKSQVFEKEALAKAEESENLRQLIADKFSGLVKYEKQYADSKKKYQDTVTKIDADGISNYDRCKRLCQSRQEAGYACEPTYCEKFK